MKIAVKEKVSVTLREGGSVIERDIEAGEFDAVSEADQIVARHLLKLGLATAAPVKAQAEKVRK